MRKCGRRFSMFDISLLPEVSASHALTAAMNMKRVELWGNKGGVGSKMPGDPCLAACTFSRGGNGAKVPAASAGV